MSTRIIVDEDEPQDEEDPPFEQRDVQIRTDKWVKEEFEIHEFLGRGKFGEVKRCCELSTGREFAAKFICSPRPQDKKDVVHEMDIMKKLQHKRLIQLYDAFESKTEMCLILEIIYGGELFDRVISDDFILTEKACVAFVRQICEGLEYMHSKKIIHLDMKPENILCLTRTGNRIKIIDFGLAREFHPKKDLRVLFGTPEFMAPEVVQYEPINFGTDMWSVGVICYVLLSGLSPFMGDSDGDTLTNVIKGQYDFNYAEFDDVTDEAKDMIAKLLAKDRNKRLTATDCLNHPWLKKPTSQGSERNSPSLQLTKKRLKRFVYRRKWQKIVMAIIALRRMGFPLMSIKRTPLGHVASSEEIFGRELTATELERAFDFRMDDIHRSLEVKTYELNRRKPSDSGYESVAVDKDITKDRVAEVDGMAAEAELCINEENDMKLDDAGVSADLGNEDTVAEASFTLSYSVNTSETPTENSQKQEKKKVKNSPFLKPITNTRKSSDGTGHKKSVMERFGGLFNKDSKDTKKDTKDNNLGTTKKDVKSKTPAYKTPEPKAETHANPKPGITEKAPAPHKKDTHDKSPPKKDTIDKSPPKKDTNDKSPITAQKDKDRGAKKEKDKNSVKKRDKDKSPTGLVKKDSTKRKVGQRALKQEVYVSTPAVKHKELSSQRRSSTDSEASSSNGKKTPGKSDNNTNSNGDSDNNTPSILLGNVKNKRKMFENNARAS